MDVLRFHNPTAAGLLESGEIINGLKSKMWVERYRDAGSFEFVAYANSDAREKLPIGAFISHVDTTEVMVVENHEISEDADKDPEIKISGRGFESIFEQRIVGTNKAFPSTATITDFTLAADELWDQAKTLIDNHTQAALLVDDDDSLPYFNVLTDVIGPGVSVERIVKRGDLYKAVKELLAVEDLGMKIVRPGPWHPDGAAGVNTSLVIHKGVDRSAEIVFSYETGEIESADYLWSNKKHKNAAIVSGKWVETMVTTATAFYDRRVMLVDAKDIDDAYTEAPTGATLTAVLALMQSRGLSALAAQKDVALTKPDIFKEAINSRYRTDFSVGDLIRVQGNYNEVASMRVNEYVEIEDENGRSGSPTLTMV